MPTKRFYHLPEEKKKAIRTAAFHEFARVPVDKVSINQIIKEAGISRGSFYTYFADKWDVLSCIFEESHREMSESMYVCMETSGGDIWYMLESLLKEAIVASSGEEHRRFLRNVMEHTSSEEWFRSLGKPSGRDEALEEEAIRWMYDHYSREKLKELNYSEFTAFFQLAVIAVAIEVKAYFEGKSEELIYESFRHKLDILKWGLCSPGKPDLTVSE